MIDIRIPVQGRKTIQPIHEFVVDQLWFIPRPWPANWEWYYDFPEIRRDIKRTINRLARRMWIMAGSVVGYHVRADSPAVDDSTVYVPVKEIREAVEKLNWVRAVMCEPIMIVVGAEEYHQLLLMEQEFLGLRINYRVGNGPNIFLFSIPIILSRLHSGMVILPDMTGGCSFRLIDTNPHYMDRRSEFRPDEYMPRWTPK